MGIITTFNKDNYQEALMAGECEPYGVYSPFINIDLIKYNNLRSNTSPPDLCPIQRRLSVDHFSNIRGCIGLTLRYARTFFPAYEFFVNEFINDEWISSVDWHKKFHRDHIIHQPMSVYVGLSLLRGFKFQKNPIFFNEKVLSLCLNALRQSDYIREYFEDMKISPMARLELETLFIDTFFLATLFHDIGYPWQFVNAICKKLGNHVSDIPLNQSTEQILNRYSKRLLFYPFNGYKKPDLTEPSYWQKSMYSFISDGMHKTHGMPGAISFLYLNDILRQYPENDSPPLRRFCLEWAAMAILMHDMADFYAEVDENSRLQIKKPQLRLSIEKDPLSFMLTLTDQIQDFNRPDATFSEHRTPISTDINIRYSYRCDKVELHWEDSSRVLTIKYFYNNPRDYLENRNEFLPKRQLQYFDPYRGYLDYSGLGISEIKLEAKLVRP